MTFITFNTLDISVWKRASCVHCVLATLCPCIKSRFSQINIRKRLLFHCEIPMKRIDSGGLLTEPFKYLYISNIFPKNCRLSVNERISIFHGGIMSGVLSSVRVQTVICCDNSHQCYICHYFLYY